MIVAEAWEGVLGLLMEVFEVGLVGPVWMLQLANRPPLASQMLDSTDVLTINFSPLNETHNLTGTFHKNIAIVKAGEGAG